MNKKIFKKLVDTGIYHNNQIFLVEEYIADNFKEIIVYYIIVILFNICAFFNISPIKKNNKWNLKKDIKKFYIKIDNKQISVFSLNFKEREFFHFKCKSVYIFNIPENIMTNNIQLYTNGIKYQRKLKLEKLNKNL